MAVTLGLLLGMTLLGRCSVAEAQAAGALAVQDKSEKPSAPEPSPKPQLETPTAQPSPTQETGTPSGTGQKREGEPTQKLQLETPKEAPATQQKLETPVAPGPARSEQQQAVIEDIIFRGNRRIPAATLRARILSRKGDLYDENALERDFMAL